jgi:hypothetical protein
MCVCMYVYIYTCVCVSINFKGLKFMYRPQDMTIFSLGPLTKLNLAISTVRDSPSTSTRHISSAIELSTFSESIMAYRV